MNESWAHGYYAEEGYEYGFYQESTPAHIRWACALQGIEAPADHFTLVDLGCGQGVALIMSAMFHPESKFIGVDFMPKHIAHANQLAEAAGVSNVTFIEADFLDLATNTERIGQVDYVVAHGITSWVAPEVADAMFELASAVLKPGGVMYNSYNTFPGWFDASPVQHLIRLEMRTKQGLAPIVSAAQLLDELKNADAKIFELLPGLSKRIESLNSCSNGPYLMQEFNNQYWKPRYFAEMVDVAHRHKLEYAGSANLCELIESSYTEANRILINRHKDLKTRETMRDFILGQCFRRDLYAKGCRSLWSTKKAEVLQSQCFVPVPFKAVPETGPFEFFQGHLRVPIKQEAILPVLKAFEPSGSSVAQVHAKVSQYTMKDVVEMTSFLYHGGWLAPQNGSDTTAVKRLNRALVDLHMQGAPYDFLTMGRGLTARRLSDVDMILCAHHLNGVSRDGLQPALLKSLLDLERWFLIDGIQVGMDSDAGREEALRSVERFCDKVLPHLVALDAL